MRLEYWDNAQILLMGLLGGLIGTCIGLQGARQYLLRYYLRYTRLKDYERIRRVLFELLHENKAMKKTLREIQKDIYELYEQTMEK